MINLVLDYGTAHQDKIILRRKEAQRLLYQMQEDIKLVKKILDKGGVTVVAESDTIITTYNFEQ